MKATTGKAVKIEYTGKFDDGQVFDSSKGREPLEFVLGSGQVIPGFDKAVMNMEVGEEKTVKIESKDSYGERKEELKQVIPRSQLPPTPEPKVGMQLVMQTPQGQQMPAMIAKVEDDKVTLDLNHPLAGKDLTFEIKLVEVNDKLTKPIPQAHEHEHECCGSGNCSDKEGKEKKEGECNGSGNCHDKESKEPSKEE
jgi:peptidylprolyl isomerase